MTNMNQVAIQAERDEQAGRASVHLDTGEDQPLVIEPEQQSRAGFYSLLAALLRNPPDQTVLDQVAALASGAEVDSATNKTTELRGELTVALSMLGLAASTSHPSPVDDEYHDLFIGLGRGELVPFGSWYQTGFLMEKPLGFLRDDLARLGYQREAGVHEPEDHVAALCEVMMFLIADGVSQERQAHFFNAHMAEWIERFFSDLGQARAAVFYRAVGRLGQAFIDIEKQYLSMPA